MAELEGKKVVITGGSTGFGLTTARLLVDRGARVLVTGRSEAGLVEAQRVLGETALVVRSDASSMTDISDLADLAGSHFGTVDALFVNAGIARFASFVSTPEQVFDEIFDINAKGPYFTVQRFVPLMRPGSAVVLTTSIANSKGLPMVSAYSASKAAVRSMTRSLARELLDRGIRVNAVSPGPIDTGILRKSMPEEAVGPTMDQMAKDVPMLRFGRSSEIADTVVYLAFDATYTTGSEVVVDGGASQL